MCTVKIESGLGYKSSQVQVRQNGLKSAIDPLIIVIDPISLKINGVICGCSFCGRKSTAGEVKYSDKSEGDQGAQCPAPI